MELESVYTSEMNYVIDGMIERYVSEIVDKNMDYEIYEDYKLLKTIFVGDALVVVFKSQLQNKTTKEMKDGICIYIIPEEYDTVDLVCDACCDNEYLFCMGLEK